MPKKIDTDPDLFMISKQFPQAVNHRKITSKIIEEQEIMEITYQLFYALEVYQHHMYC